MEVDGVFVCVDGGAGTRPSLLAACEKNRGWILDVLLQGSSASTAVART